MFIIIIIIAVLKRAIRLKTIPGDFQAHFHHHILLISVSSFFNSVVLVHIFTDAKVNKVVLVYTFFVKTYVVILEHNKRMIKEITTYFTLLCKTVSGCKFYKDDKINNGYPSIVLPVSSDDT